MKKGKVYLIGAGPGDPELLTLKGKRALEEADCVVYDRLANPKLLSFASKKAELIYAGKKPDSHTLKQHEIDALLVEKGLEGKIVARLKGGDPFVFGRGGEECEELKKNDVPFEIVPGITSAIAVPAYAGIPVTQRNVNISFTVITGHEDPYKETSMTDWKKLASKSETLVILMGMGRLGKIVEKLIEHGTPPDTPVALIMDGTRSTQKTLVSDLSSVEADAKEKGFKPPVIIIVGNVVGMREKLKWFENRPLFSKNIVVTRARAQASDLSALLIEKGASVIEFPVIKIIPPESYKGLDKAIDNICSYKWIIFTSTNGVKAFFERVFSKGKDVRLLSGAKVCAIGKQTGKELKLYGLTADYIPKKFVAEDLVANFPDFKKGTKILIPRAKEAREVIPEELTKAGGNVEVVTAYETVREEEYSNELKTLLSEDKLDMITFTSSSTVKNFVEITEEQGIKRDEFKNTLIAAIGPITGKTAEKYGFKVNLMPEAYTIKDLVCEILKYYEKV